jgi:hypothetical protein
MASFLNKMKRRRAVEATLIIGENCEECSMQVNKIYNVKRDIWHNIIVSRDARVLIVENDNTGLENTEYLPLS